MPLNKRNQTKPNHSYLIQKIWAQLNGFKYSYLTLKINPKLYDCKKLFLFYNKHLFAQRYIPSSNQK